MFKQLPALTFATALLVLAIPSSARKNIVNAQTKKSGTQTIIITQPAYSDTQTILLTNSSSNDTMVIVIPPSEYADTLRYVITTEESSYEMPAQGYDSNNSVAQAAKSNIPGYSKSSPATPSGTKQTTGDWRQYCLDVINQYRASENVKPLKLADNSKQTCADKQAAADLRTRTAHGHFGDCNESGQNTGPDVDLKWYKTEAAIIDEYLKLMWDEKKLIENGERDPNNDADYSYIGHYLNMRDPEFKSVGCGIAKSSDGKTGWFNTNFYRR